MAVIIHVCAITAIHTTITNHYCERSSSSTISSSESEFFRVLTILCIDPGLLPSSMQSSVTYNLINYNYAIYLAYLLLLVLLLVVPGPSLSIFIALSIFITPSFILLLLMVLAPSLILSSLIDVSRSVGLLCGSCHHPCLCRIFQAHSYFNVLCHKRDRTDAPTCVLYTSFAAFLQLPQEGVHHPASTYYHFHLLPLHLGVRFLWVLTICIDPWLPNFHNRPTVVSACILFCNEFATQHQE